MDTIDTNGRSTLGDVFDVSTHPNENRDANSGVWVFEPAGGQTGSDVKNGDIVHLKNLYGEKTYLDTYEHAPAPEKYNVQTSNSPDRDSGSGRWQVQAQSPRSDGKIMYGDVVHFFNQYGNNGGFLDTCNPSTAGAGAKYDVYTSDASARDGLSGSWRMYEAAPAAVAPAPAPPTVPKVTVTGLDCANSWSRSPTRTRHQPT